MSSEQRTRNTSITAEVLASNLREVHRAWSERVFSVLNAQASGRLNRQDLEVQLDSILKNIGPCFCNESGKDLNRLDSTELSEILSALSVSHAKLGISPTETAVVVLSLKDVLFSFIREAAGQELETLNSEMIRIGWLVDRLALVSFESFSRAREDVIAQQSRSLLELSTPAIKLWDKILLLPLIGVVDTMRAAQVIEGLLQSIVDTESQIAILDITGVPIIDTRVAHHLIKTIAAAKMLGAEVIVTGISPDTAQTMVKLNIDLGAVRTCGTLRAGVAEAFRLSGKAVVEANSDQK